MEAPVCFHFEGKSFVAFSHSEPAGQLCCSLKHQEITPPPTSLFFFFYLHLFSRI